MKTPRVRSLRLSMGSDLLHPMLQFSYCNALARGQNFASFWLIFLWGLFFLSCLPAPLSFPSFSPPCFSFSLFSINTQISGHGQKFLLLLRMCVLLALILSAQIVSPPQHFVRNSHTARTFPPQRRFIDPCTQQKMISPCTPVNYLKLGNVKIKAEQNTLLYFPLYLFSHI